MSGPWEDYKEDGPWADYKEASSPAHNLVDKVKESVKPAYDFYNEYIGKAIPQVSQMEQIPAGIQSLAGLLAGAGGAILGGLTPGTSAKEEYENFSKTVNDRLDFLAPKTKAGKDMAEGVGEAAAGVKDWAPNVSENVLSAVPFIGPDLATNDKYVPLRGAISAAITSAPEVSMLTPFLGGGKFKGKLKADDVASRAKKAFDEEAKPTTEAEVSDGPWEDYRKGSTQYDPFAQMKQQLGADQTMPMGPERPEGFVNDQAPMDSVVQGLGQMADNQRTSAAQAAIDARQAQMEFEVKKQAGLDFNAAERGRQDAAPTGYWDRMLEIAEDQGARLNRADFSERFNQAQGDAAGPIYVDPQAQAFRGNPAEADPRLALENQTDAMDRELTHLQGKGTPVGEPLRPLRDIPVEQNRDVAKQTAVEQGTAADTNREGPISSKGKRGRQRGAVDLSVLKDAVDAGFDKIKEALDSIHIPHELARDVLPAMREVYDKTENPKVFEFAKNELSQLGYPEHVLDSFDHATQAAEIYSDAKANSNVIPFQRKGVPLSQRGAVGDLRPRPSQTGANAEVVGKPKEKPIDPVALAKRTALANSKLVKNFGLDEFDTIHSKEEALTLAAGAKDIPKNYGQKELMSGINTATILSNNPVLKFARTVFRDARNYADQFSRTYITDNKVGLSPLWSRMNAGERVAAMEVLMEGDRRKEPVTESVMQRMEFTDTQKQFVHTFYSADKALFEKGNEAMAKLGLKLTDEREGHFPGIFRGAYKTVAFTRAGENGRIKVLGVIATDTVAQLKMAKEWAQKQLPSAEFLDKQRQSMAGQRYGSSDILSGMNDVLDILSREDPTFKEVQDILDGAVKQANNALFNFNVHQLHKKGVFGNAGNKPWLSPEKNANEAFKALVGYFEEGSMHHALQVPLKEVRDTLVAPETDHMPNMKKYLTDYTKKVTGDDLNDVGRHLNGLIDFPFRFVPAVSFGVAGPKFGFGVGPSVPLKFAGALKNNMSQLYMGWLNYMFTASQLVQPIQTGIPFLQLVSGRIGANPLEVPYSLAKGGVQFLAAATEHLIGHNMGVVDPVMRNAFKYAVDRGMATFSEMERAYQGTQTKLGRAKDQVAEVNMKLGEQLTRTPMFMSFADMLVRKGMEEQKAFQIAENLTQEAMIDYHQWERPMVYSKLGVVGGFMGGLTTFKHGFVGQQVYLGKQLFKPAAGKRQAAPIAASIGSMLIFAGITGLPFYQELDSMYHMLTNHFGGEARSIREDFLQQLPDWLQHGAVSAATGLNLQGKFSSADMVPDADHAFRALSPHLEGAGKIAGSVYDVLKSGGDTQSLRNLVVNSAPSGWRGAAEGAMSRDQNNYLVGKDGLPMFQRTDDEWQTRELTGIRTQ
jgi:hypothetical protein